MSDDVEEELEEIEAMFVQVAREMATEGGRVKLLRLGAGHTVLLRSPAARRGPPQREAVRR